MAATPKRRPMTLSPWALTGLAGVATVVLASLFAYILAIAELALDARLWWIGFVSGVFALAFFGFFKMTQERRVVQPLAASFFIVSVASFYISIIANPDPGSTKLFWILFLSMLLAVPLLGIRMMGYALMGSQMSGTLAPGPRLQATRACPKCGQPNSAAMRFCGNCGADMTVTGKPCVKCGKPVPQGMKYCGECGSPQVVKCPEGHEVPGSLKFCRECGKPVQVLV